MTKASKIHFITYGSDERWIYALDRIAHDAKKCAVFDSITCYAPEMLDRDFAKRYATVLKRARGGGFWIWKPQIIRQKLDECEPGDAVLYADAGCRLNHKSAAELRQRIADLKQSPYGMLAFARGPSRDHAMTNQAINYFKRTYGMDDGFRTQHGIAAGALIFLKNDHAYKILDEFERLLRADMLLITDAYDRLPQHPRFIGKSRYDETIFTLLVYLFGCVRLNQFQHWWKRDYFLIPARLRFNADIYGLFRVHGALAPLYLADCLAGAPARIVIQALKEFKRQGRRAPLVLITKYRRNRRALFSGFFIDTNYRLTRYLGVALRKIKRGGV